MPRPIQELARQALAVQDACNLSAVVKAFSEALDDLWPHAQAEERGTDWVNQHPITRAYVSKLASLSGHERGDGTFSQVIHLARQPEPARAK